MADEEFRKGYAFGNPDITSSHHAKDWGLLVTPDELRYDVMFGTKLTSPDANQTYNDPQLQYYIDYAINMLEKDLSIDILPRSVRYEDPINPVNGQREARTDIPQDELDMGRLLIREEGYSYRQTQAKHYLYIKLRRRPLLEVVSAQMIDPIQNSLINLFPWRRERRGFESVVQFFPNTHVIGTFPFLPGRLTSATYPFQDFPAAFYLDYKTGFLTADLVDPELRMPVLWTAGILLMENFGDGKAPGIASASANLNSISESYSTTQSATNALYGARISYYKEHLKNWLKMNKDKYARNVIGVF